MKRCLIIDDSAVIRKVAKRILSGPDLRVLEAESGHDGLAKCRAEMPEYIILDAGLPDISTLEFLAALKPLAPRGLPVVLLLMVELDIVPIMRAKRAGAAGYLLKPFDRAQLTARFAEYRDLANGKNRAA